MRTRLVRVRRRGRSMWWAILFLLAALLLYIRVSMPTLGQLRESIGQQQSVSTGERVTREITVEALSVYLISFGAYDSAPSAQIEAARYVSRGAAGYVLTTDVRQVVGAGYDDREQAQTVCAQLQKREGIAASVIDLSAPQLRVRITAGSEQIAAFLAAEQTMRSAAQALGQLSFALDRQEATALQAGKVIQTHHKKVKDALEGMEAKCAGQSNVLFDPLTEMMRSMLAQMDKMQQETVMMALSSRLKYFYIDARVQQIEWMNDILNG